MKIIRRIALTDRRQWRLWLEANHAAETEVWLLFSKKETGRPSIPYEEAVEEALCFGWIDSIVQNIDAVRYARKFTPRKSGSKWSALNKQRAARMIREGRMTEAGRAKMRYSGSEDDYGRQPERRSAEPIIPEYFKQALLRNSKAWENYSRLSPSYRRNYIGWIAAAKTADTRSRRLAEAVRLLVENRKLGLK